MNVFPLRAVAKSYEWGSLGSQSKVAQYAKASPPFEIDETSPYAELWMGTHPSGPAELTSSNQGLKEHIEEHPELLGADVRNHFGNDLPFLFKILAISKPLSIQAHPDKELASKLHKEHPDIYKDSNHKPEMAIAITPFEAFCGFRPPSSIAVFLSSVPEFASVVSQPVAASFQLAAETPSANPSDPDHIKVALRELFVALMTAPTAAVIEAIASIRSRYTSGRANPEEASIQELFIRLDDQFPSDIGVLCVYILNVVKLEPGQAIFLRANEPHAYISGDIVETMATSDNVIRAGLTPKLRDVDTLTSMLTYSYQPAEDQILKPKQFPGSQHTLLYDPPIDEFAVLLTRLGPGEHETHNGIAGPSILIVTEGQGIIQSDGIQGGEHEFRSNGEVFFVAADTKVTFRAAADRDLAVFRAFTVSPSM